MNLYIVDIVIAIPIIWAMFKGYTEGVWIQLGGLAGVIVGIWIGLNFGEKIGAWMNLTGNPAYIVGFITAIVGVLISVAIISRLIKGLFKVSGLGFIDHIGGVLIAMCKAIIVIALIIEIFDIPNKKYNWVDKKYINSSILYNSIKSSANKIFPQVINAKNQILKNHNNNKPE